ncbi:MAG: D-glycero-beta-D-manno-heptose 1,7-bisphosphate 7-phosphatase [Desulfovibrio sp.]|jgi:D-glycero-D-manno-heptose 1,7-bisphosphate phosphatase|nr:D-glycero-beta-D-manno-heptose 1,7-bisphosphate 7-phosphatase [Desulfovibrio sp.]
MRAVFLDRDGTLNRETGYLHDREDWCWLPGVPQALARLCGRGYRLVVVSNQSGLARGLYGREAVDAVHRWVNKDLARFDAVIEAFYYCPHHPEFSGECSCRKPKPGLLLQAAEELGLDCRESWMTGDKISDILAGRAAGCRSILLRTGYGREAEAEAPEGLPVVDDLPAAAEYIIRADGVETA